jgi:hypothetical protein
LVYPGIQFKSVEGNALPADADFSQMRPYLRIEAVAVHADVTRGIAEAEQSRRDGWRMFHLAYP